MDTETPPTPLLAWRARTRPKHERTKMWYTIAGIFAGLLLTYSVVTQAWSFLVLIVMTLVVFYFFEHRAPDTVSDIAIWSDGVELDGQMYHWKQLNGFWFLHYQDYIQLHIEHDDDWRHDTVIQTGPVSVAAITRVLSAQLPHHTDRREQPLDTISRICKI